MQPTVSRSTHGTGAVLEQLMAAPAELGDRATRHIEALIAASSSSSSASFVDPPIVIVLSGSLNPVHRSHVQLLHEAVRSVEATGKTVLAALLAPSSHSYVRGKLGDEAIPLPLRVAMCQAAVREDGADYLGVVPWGMASGSDICRRLEAVELPKHCTVPADRLCAAIAVYGSDFLVRCPGCLRKPTLIYGRQDSDGTAMEAQRLIAQARAENRLHPNFTYVAPSPHTPDDDTMPSAVACIPELSSSQIRRLASEHLRRDDAGGDANVGMDMLLESMRNLMHSSVTDLYLQFLTQSPRCLQREN